MVCVTVYRQQVSCKLSTDLLQVDCQNLLSTGWLQVVTSLILAGNLMKLAKVNVDNSQQICGIFG